jgi:hypothetical protein
MGKLRLRRVSGLSAVTHPEPYGEATYFLSLCLTAHHLGTIFLWIFWPSFNSAPTSLGDVQHRTALNTYYSLTASTLSTFALSAFVSGDGRLDMVWGGGLGKAEGLAWQEERSKTLRPCREVSRAASMAGGGGRVPSALVVVGSEWKEII